VTNDSELVLRSGRFRAERQSDWRKLELLLDRVEARGPRALSDADLLALPGLYRSALASLSVARAISLDRALVGYLEDLAGRAYFFVYGSRSSRLQQISRFFRDGWPSSIQRMIPDIAVAAAVMLLAAVAAYLLVLSDPDWFYSMVPADLAGGRTPSASAEYLRSTLFDGEFSNELSVFATYLFTHNAGVSLLAFAVGFAFGLPSLLLMAYNGCTIGALVAVFAAQGLGVELAGWLAIHGVTELLAISIAGGAGLHIGRAMIFSGNLTRLESAAIAGRRAAQAMGGVIVMLLLAGVLEGVGRQTINDTNIRFAVAGATAILWSAYLFIPRRSRADA
jgi:uncharacterized membrane protein SpoIIM required for sporulation